MTHRVSLMVLGLLALVLVPAGALLAQPNAPQAVWARRGYHSAVPLSWIPPSGAPATTRSAGATREMIDAARLEEPAGRSPVANRGAGSMTYRVYRALAGTGPFTLIADNVPISSYRDTGVVNEIRYFYKVSAVEGGLESDLSPLVWATPTLNGNRIVSGYTTTPPVVDGRIFEGTEWADAAVVDIRNTRPGGGSEPVTAFIMNSDNTLYIGVRDANMPFPDDFNQVGVYFDENRDGAWNSPPGRPEGNVWIIYDVVFNETTNWFRAFSGEWPNTAASQFGPVGGVQQALGFSSGDHDFEIAIGLNASPLVSAPGRVIGFALYSDHSGEAPFSGDWPLGLIGDPVAFDDPMAYGELTLGGPPGTPVVLPVEPPDTGLTASPNPVVEGAVFRVTGADPDERVLVFDVSGRLVTRVPIAGGGARWNGRDDRGQSVPPGTYFYRLEKTPTEGGRLLLVR